MLSEPDGSPGRSTSAIRSAGRTILPQRDLALLAENAFLRQQNAAQNERIEELENPLKKYENAHMLSSQQDGAGQQPQNEESEQDEENDEAGGDLMIQARSESSLRNRWLEGRYCWLTGTTKPADRGLYDIGQNSRIQLCAGEFGHY